MSPTVLKRGLLLLTVALLIPVASGAQDAVDVIADVRLKAEATAPEATSQIRDAVRLYPLPIVQPESARQRFQDSSNAPLTGKPRKSVIGWAIAIGVGAGLGASAIAASKYGENEGGEFCGRCFMEWSAITVPVGAGAGALVGYLIDQSRR
ncbi:MAG TPA: hypothetical protein VFT39_06900 [Vicinamibacterales bacterium]|nr:hypothetical protein [Vicinamibacterales bacterium]